MRFFADGPDIPDDLLYECDKGNVVFLCGAGVSIPSGLPSFSELTQKVAAQFDPDPSSPVTQALKPWIENDLEIPPAARVSFDQIFNLIYSRIPEKRVNDYIKEILGGYEADTWPHDLISSLSANEDGYPQIVTTNFDTLFERSGKKLVRFEPPLLPNLDHRNASPVGITYLHGRLVDNDEKQPNYVLSSSDFGRAYLAEGWATSYVRELLKNHYVVMVGYTAEDPPVKYLLQGLDSSSNHERSKLFVFDSGTIDEVHEKWKGRGVTPMAYQWTKDHRHLWETIRSWSLRKKNPPEWRQSVISMAQTNPRDLKPHERGKVLHVVRHPVGMREFADAEISPHPEWVCVFDVRVRYGDIYEPYHHDQVSKPVDPLVLYGTDTDKRIVNVERDQPNWPDTALDILAYQDFDGSASDSTRFSGGCFNDMSPVLGRFENLLVWLAKNLESQAILWWFSRQVVLLPWVKSELKRQLLSRSSELDEGMYKSWEILMESINASEVRLPYDYIGLTNSVKIGGWNILALRRLKNLLSPQIKIDRGFSELSVVPPVDSTHVSERLPLHLVCRLSVDFTHCGSFDEIRSVLDSDVEKIIPIVSESIREFESLSDYSDCYVSKEFDLDSGNDWDEGIEKLTRIFYELLKRLSESKPGYLKRFFESLNVRDDNLFFKVSIKFWPDSRIFSGEVLGNLLLENGSDRFWAYKYRKDIFYTLSKRWDDFSVEIQRRIEQWLVAPRPNWHKQDDDAYNRSRFDRSIISVRWLQKSGVRFDDEFIAEVDKLQIQGDKVSKEDIDTFVDSSSQRPLMERVDESYDYLDGVEDHQLIDKIISHVKRNNTVDVAYKPLVGIAKNDPERAFKALVESDDPPAYMIVQFLDHVSKDFCVSRVLGYLYSLPCGVVFDICHSILSYSEKKLDASSNNYCKELLSFCEWFIGVLSNDQAEGLKSSIYTSYESPRQGVEYAINSISGSLVSRLLAASEDSCTIGDVLEVVDKIINIGGEARNHAIYTCCSNFGYLSDRNLKWCEDKLLPYFSIISPSSPSAWFGLLSRNHPGWVAEVWSRLKYDFLNLPDVISKWSPNRDWDAPFDWLIYSGVRGEGCDIEITRSECKIFISKLDDKQRSRFIFRIRQFFHRESDKSLVVNFIRDCWPFDKTEEQSKASEAWIQLLMDIEEDIARRDLYSIVKDELKNVRDDGFNLFEMYHRYNDHVPMADSHPEIALDILHRAIPMNARGYILTEISNVLSAVAKQQPDLRKDGRYERLMEIVSGVS